MCPKRRLELFNPFTAGMNECVCVGLEIRLKFVRSKAGKELSNCVHYKIYLATICLNEM